MSNRFSKQIIYLERDITHFFLLLTKLCKTVVIKSWEIFETVSLDVIPYLDYGTSGLEDSFQLHFWCSVPEQTLSHWLAALNAKSLQKHFFFVELLFFKINKWFLLYYFTIRLNYETLFKDIRIHYLWLSALMQFQGNKTFAYKIHYGIIS